MAEREQPLPGVDAWQTVLLRVTLFSTPGSPRAEVGEWWKIVTGEEPESITDQRKVENLAVQGPFLGGALVLTVGFNRYSWDLTTRIDVEKGINDIPKIGSFPEVRDGFLKAMEGWFPSAPPVVRAAFGANVMLPRNSKADSFSFLNSVLPYRLDPDNSGDFSLRINRYASSVGGLAGLRINRLRDWSAVIFKVNVATVGTVKTLVHEQQACLLELDINTDADRTEVIPADRLSPLVYELADLGTEVIARGEYE